MDTSTIGSPEKLLNIFQGYPKQLVAVKTVDRVVSLLAREVMGVLQLQNSLFEPFSQALRRAEAVAGRGLASNRYSNRREPWLGAGSGEYCRSARRDVFCQVKRRGRDPWIRILSLAA